MRKLICLCAACCICLCCIAGAYAGTLPEELPTAERPYAFTPAFTVRLDLLAAQWMMTENNRAFCTVLLALDLVMTDSSLFEARPMYVYESRIGKAEDTIRILIQSQDQELAYIILYDTLGGSALFYAEPWNDETLAAFEKGCTDQFFANGTDSLDSAYSYIMEIADTLFAAE